MASGIVLLHGIARTSGSMKAMAQALDRAGFETLNLDYDSRRMPLDRIAADIRGPIADFAERHPGGLHFVTHSMGGLVARVYLAGYPPEPPGRVVMLGPPNNGSEVADLLHRLAVYRAYFGPAGQQLTTRHGASLLSALGPIRYPLGIIAGSLSIDPISSLLLLPGPNDGKVTVRSTRLEGMADHIVIRAAHPWLPRSAVAIAQTIAFLRTGRFSVPGRSAARARRYSEVRCF